MFEDTQEQWKDIDGFEGLYSVSTKGRVRNIKTGRILVAKDNGNGYLKVNLKRKNYYIHRLTALAFIPNPDNLPEVDHVDECKKNNDVSNLRWVSKSENTRHSIYKCSCKVKQIDKNGNLIKIWDSFYQIVRELDYERSSIIMVCKGRRRYAHGFKWEYLDSSSQRVYNRQVIAYKGTEFIGEFANATKASEALGLKYHSVYQCLRGCIASTHGYTFEYK